MANDEGVSPSKERQVRVAAIKTALAKYDDHDWPDILNEAHETKREWESASADLQVKEISDGLRDADPWRPGQIMNHVGAYLAGIAQQLEIMLQGKMGDYDTVEQWQGDNIDLETLNSTSSRGWSSLLNSAMGASTGIADNMIMRSVEFGELPPKQVVAFAIRHVNGHILQMREARSTKKGNNSADPNLLGR